MSTYSSDIVCYECLDPPSGWDSAPASIRHTGLMPPANKESAGKHMAGPMNRGNVWLRAIMGEVAWASVKSALYAAQHAVAEAATEASHFYAQFHRIARRRGRNKAAIAVAHSLLTAVYHVLRTGQPDAELRVDYFDCLDAARVERHHVRRLEQLGHSVTFTPMTA